MTNNQLAENSVTQLLNSVKLARDNAERDDNRVDHSFYYALTIALEELQERRKAELDSEPVGKPFMYGIADPDGNAYIDELCVSEDLGLVEDTVNELNYDREEGDELNYSVVALYRHAQPAPVVQCPFPCGWDNLNKLAIQNAAFVACALIAGEPATESLRQAAISNNDYLLKVISACRTAMLEAAPPALKQENI